MPKKDMRKSPMQFNKALRKAKNKHAKSDNIAKRIEWNKEKQMQRMSPPWKHPSKDWLDDVPSPPSDDDLMLVNQGLGALANPERGLMQWQKKSRIAEQMRRKLQRNLIEAQKFELDDKLVEHCVWASMDNPKRLAQMVDRAIPPFDLMWIEWRDEVRVKAHIDAYKKMHPEKLIDENLEGVSPRVGYLIERKHNATLFTLMMTYDDKFYACGTSFYLADESEFDLEFRQSISCDNKELDELAFADQLASFAILIGDVWYKEYMGHYDNELEYMAKQIIPAQGYGQLSITDQENKTGWDPQWMANKTAKELNLSRGDLRFLICAIGFLNYDHIILEEKKPNPKVKHMRYGHRTPENEYRKVYIDLPKRSVTMRRGILTGKGTPKKQHWRRGHWRTYQNGVRVWIKPCQAGNPELGIVEHDYFLRGKKD